MWGCVCLKKLDNKIRISHYKEALVEITDKKYSDKSFTTELKLLDEFKSYVFGMNSETIKKEKEKIKLRINGTIQSNLNNVITAFLTIIIAFFPLIFIFTSEHSSQLNSQTMTSAYSINEEVLKITSEIEANKYKIENNFLTENETVEELENTNKVLEKKSEVLKSKANEFKNVTLELFKDALDTIIKGAQNSITYFSLIFMLCFFTNQYFVFKSAHKKAFYIACVDILDEKEKSPVNNEQEEDLENSRSIVEEVKFSNIDNITKLTDISTQTMEEVVMTESDEKDYTKMEKRYKRFRKYYKKKINNREIDIRVEKVRLEAKVGKFDSNIKSYSINYLISFMVILFTLYLESSKIFEFQVGLFSNNDFNNILTVSLKGILFMGMAYFVPKIILNKDSKKEREEEFSNNLKIRVVEDLIKDIDSGKIALDEAATTKDEE